MSGRTGAELSWSVSRSGPMGLRMHAVHVTPADPVGSAVLVHGMVVAGRSMLPLAWALAGHGVAAHVPDLPGFGRSEKPDRALDVDGLAGHLVDWMRVRRLAGATVVGNSFGTQVAGAALAGAPDAGARLVLVSPTIDARFRRRWTRLLPAGKPAAAPLGGVRGRLGRFVAELAVPQTDRSAPLSSLLRREYPAAGLPRALSTYRHALRDDLAARMASIAVPVLVVRGAADGVVSRAWAGDLAAGASEGTLLEIDGAGHDLELDKAGELASVVVGFLDAGTRRPADQNKQA